MVFSLFFSFRALLLLLLISSCSSFTVDLTLIYCYKFIVSLPLLSSGLKLMLNRSEGSVELLCLGGVRLAGGSMGGMSCWMGLD